MVAIFARCNRSRKEHKTLERTRKSMHGAYPVKYSSSRPPVVAIHTRRRRGAIVIISCRPDGATATSPWGAAAVTPTPSFRTMTPRCRRAAPIPPVTAVTAVWVSVAIALPIIAVVPVTIIITTVFTIPVPSIVPITVIAVGTMTGVSITSRGGTAMSHVFT